MKADAKFRFLIPFLLPVLFLSLASCATTKDAENRVQKFQLFFQNRIEKFPDYHPYSQNLLVENLGDDVWLLPASYAWNPEKDMFVDQYIPDAEGPRLYTDGKAIVYFIVNHNSITRHSVDPETMELKFAVKDFTKPEKMPRWFEKKTEGLERVELSFLRNEVRGSQGSAMTGCFEAVCRDFPVYVYENYYPSGEVARDKETGQVYRTGIRCDAQLVIAGSREGIERVISPEALYPGGYHYVTGFSREGYDRQGYGEDGYSRFGFDRRGYDRAGNRYSGRIGPAGATGYGTLAWADGDAYRGYFRNNRIHGLGVVFGADGTIYAGRFVEGRKDGPGVVIHADGTQEVEQWTDGNARNVSPASAAVVAPEGNWIFLGRESRNGRANGTGDAIDLESGWIISGGRFADGRLAEGTILTPEGNSYRGVFEDGLLVDGYIRVAGGSTYEGSLTEGVPEGRGRLVNVDGTTYEGEFVEGSYEGTGYLTLANGDIYDGTFRNGMPHGKGIYKNATEGTVESCEFYEGKRVDQVYLLRIAQAEQAARQEAAEERRRQEEETRRREEEARRVAAEKARESEKNNRLFGALVAAATTFAVGESIGLDTGDSLYLATAVATDVVGDTGGTNLDKAQAFLLDRNRQVETWESQYGVSDLSYVSEYSAPVSQAPTRRSAPAGGTGRSGGTAGTQTRAGGSVHSGASSQAGGMPARSRASSGNAEVGGIEGARGTENKELPPTNRSERSVLRSLIDREGGFDLEMDPTERTYRNPQEGIESLSVKFKAMTFGEAGIEAQLCWTAAAGGPDRLPRGARGIIALSNGTNTILLNIPPHEIHGSGSGYLGWGTYSSRGEMFLEKVDGADVSFLSADVCTGILEDMAYSNYSIVDAWLAW